MKTNLKLKQLGREIRRGRWERKDEKGVLLFRTLWKLK